MRKKNQTIRNKRKIKVPNYQNDVIDTKEAKKVISKGLSREVKFTIISIFIVTIVMLSSAFAIFSSVQKQEKYNTLTVGTLKVDFIDTEDGMGNIINLNGAYPESDEEGLKESPYSFKITNAGTLGASYKIKIIDDTDMIAEDGCQDNLLDKSKIRVSINGETPFTLEDTNINDYIVTTGNLSAGNNRKYEIRIWIDKSAGNEVLGKHYHGKIVVESVNSQIKNNSNIVSAYQYDEADGETKCITGEETTCVATECYKNSVTGSCKQGTIVKYKVNDSEQKVFYVLHDDGTTLTMQQRENTTNNIAWRAEENNNSYGPTTVLPELENATSTWTNVNEQNYTPGETTLYKNFYTGCTYSTTDYKVTCNTNTYTSATLGTRKSRARMITALEASDTGCLVRKNGSQDSTIVGGSINAYNEGSCPDFMHNYLYESTNYGGSVNGTAPDGSIAWAYWTMSAGSSYSSYAWSVNPRGYVGNLDTTNTHYGARAVVEISK